MVFYAEDFVNYEILLKTDAVSENYSFMTIVKFVIDKKIIKDMTITRLLTWFISRRIIIRNNYVYFSLKLCNNRKKKLL